MTRETTPDTRKANKPMIADTLSAWNLFHASVHRFLRSRLSNPADADELLQETFLRLHRAQPPAGSEREIAAWLMKTARNLVADHYRATPPVLPLPEDVADQNEPPDTALKNLESCLPPLSAHLPEIYRRALSQDLDGVPQSEIARNQHISLSGAKSRVQRARQRLKREFERCCHFERDAQGNLEDYRERACATASF